MKTNLSKFDAIKVNPASFRDPSGYVFDYEGCLYRTVSLIYKEYYDFFISSGLNRHLIDEGLIVPFEEITSEDIQLQNIYKILRPLKIPFVSYPYEWSFDQLRDAALLTIKIQKIALKYGMTLKDASSYNIQFIYGIPRLIDLLSFEIYQEGTPWIAYKQFCQHFYAPLLLCTYTDYRLLRLLKNYLDGLPLDLVSRLLPKKTLLNFPILSNIHAHSRMVKKFENSEKIKIGKPHVSKNNLLALLDLLEDSIKKLTINYGSTEWGNYYENTNYTDNSANHKKLIVEKYINECNAGIIWDLGANNGEHSRIAAKTGSLVVSYDIDEQAVNQNYNLCKQKQEKNILPLVMDLTNPSSNIGWANQERLSMEKRGPADLILALALVHHLAISNNTPFSKIADYFSELGNFLIIEFIPKSDSKVQYLLKSREDIFTEYNQENFETVFGKYFEIVKKEQINESERFVYLLKNKISK